MEELRLLDPRWQASYSARRRDEFVQRCHARGLAVTPQRLAVIQALLASNTHPSAERICATVRKQLSYISLATVHRILERYLARTRGLAEQAIFNFENSPRTKFANQLQTSTPKKSAPK